MRDNVEDVLEGKERPPFVGFFFSRSILLRSPNNPNLKVLFTLCAQSTEWRLLPSVLAWSRKRSRGLSVTGDVTYSPGGGYPEHKAVAVG